ncbi:MAG: hypothetical protein A2Z83_07215 [Omnitrophica bacterium GWA2_52_8]|nr:MAG: hypothetical protein A2Z83_07215 [Omnitrophica bacterium GWA2_52_8]
MKLWKKIPLKKKLLARISRTSPFVLARLLLTGLVLFPFWVLALIVSFVKTIKWKNPAQSVRFVREHQLAFPEIFPETLEIRYLTAGLSNLNMLWRVKLKTGVQAEYFVKVFLPLGSLWATVNAWASPFPEVRGSLSHERFTVDMVSRTLLSERGIAVPKLIAFDTVERVMVTESIQGPNVDAMLKQFEGAEALNPEIRRVIRECGSGLGRIHSEGFSLIDTQPVNCIWVAEREKVYFVDLEFCTRADQRLWDVGFFLAFLTVRLKGTAAHDARRTFLESYGRYRASDLKAILNASGKLKEYIPVFQTILDLRELSPEELLNEILS